jgi:hypothetical protein
VEANLRVVAEFAILVGGAYLLLRHVGLAALAVIAPLPGYLAVYFFFAPPLPVILAAMLLSNFLASRIALAIAQGETPVAPLLPSLGALAMATAWLFALPVDHFTWQFTAAITASMVSAFVLVPLVAKHLSFGEDFIARMNRARELRQRLFGSLEPVTRPRWGWSIAGVAFVLDAVAYFGAHVTLPSTRPEWVAAGILAGVTALVAVLVRDWRRGLSLVCALAPMALLLWWMIVLTQSFSRLSFLALGIAAAAVALMAFSAAPLRALERDGASLTISLLAGALFLALFGQVQPVVVTLMGVIAALVFQPAFAAVFESLFPRREVLDARYRVR